LVGVFCCGIAFFELDGIDPEGAFGEDLDPGRKSLPGTDLAGIDRQTVA